MTVSIAWVPCWVGGLRRVCDSSSCTMCIGAMRAVHVGVLGICSVSMRGRLSVICDGNRVDIVKCFFLVSVGVAVIAFILVGYDRLQPLDIQF
jgi:hypothetical protein